jgi:hypothetical protein
VPDITVKENLFNKQDSLVTDGSGSKYPTVDAVNAGIFASLGTSGTSGTSGTAGTRNLGHLEQHLDHLD